MALFVGLNPSIADETKNDPTQRRCMRFAYDWGFSGYFMGNIFGLVSTNPDGLKTTADPIGLETSEYLQSMTRLSDLVVVCWGVHGSLLGRGEHMLKILQAIKLVYHLGLNQDGSPKHPLYLRADTKPSLYNQASP